MTCVDAMTCIRNVCTCIWPLALLLLLAALLGSGCSTGIDPFSESANERFALTGFLTMLEDVQRVRVEQLRRTVESPEVGLEGVRVISVHEESGDRRVWEPAADQPDDIQGLIYESHFRPVEGTYRLEVGREITVDPLIARTTLPDIPDVLVGSAVGVGVGVQLPLRLLGQRDTPIELGLRYTVRPPMRPGASAEEREIDIRYGQAGSPVTGGWEFLVFVRNDHRIMLRQFGLDTVSDSLTLVAVSVIADLASDEWTDPEAVDIRNGEGFFASVARYIVPWNPPRAPFEEGGYKFLP